MVTPTIVAPAILIKAVTMEGGAGGIAGGGTVPMLPLPRMMLTVPGIDPDGGEGTNAVLGTTPAVDTVAVKVPEPESETVPVWPQPTVMVVGDTVSEGGVAAGVASPAGPSTLVTVGDSSERFWASVMTKVATPQPDCVTR